jgi:hypothetical protein
VLASRAFNEAEETLMGAGRNGIYISSGVILLIVIVVLVLLVL